MSCEALLYFKHGVICNIIETSGEANDDETVKHTIKNSKCSCIVGKISWEPLGSIALKGRVNS